MSWNWGIPFLYLCHRKTMEFCVLKEYKNFDDEKNQTEVTWSSSKKKVVIFQQSYVVFLIHSIFLKLWFVSFFKAVVCYHSNEQCTLDLCV